MSRQNLYTTPSCSMVATRNQLEQFYVFLISHSTMILNATRRKDLFAMKRTSPSTMGQLFQSLGASDRFVDLRPYIVTKNILDENELSQLRFLPMDLLQAEEVAPSLKTATSAFPDISNKVHLNITDLVKADGELTDLTVFQSRCIRDFLVRSFFVSRQKTWLNYNLLQFVGRVYNICLGRILSRTFQVDASQLSEVVAVFSLFYMAMMTTDETVRDILKVNWKTLSIPEPHSLNQIFNVVEDTLGYAIPKTLDDVFKCCAALYPEFAQLNRAVLFSKASSLVPETYVSIIALEYPPLFTHAILRVVSGERQLSPPGLTFIMKSANLIKPAQDFMERFIREAHVISVTP